MFYCLGIYQLVGAFRELVLSYPLPRDRWVPLLAVKTIELVGGGSSGDYHYLNRSDQGMGIIANSDLGDTAWAQGSDGVFTFGRGEGGSRKATCKQVLKSALENKKNFCSCPGN